MKSTYFSLLFLTTLALSPCGLGQQVSNTPANAADPKQAVKQIRDLVKQGEDGIQGIAAFSQHPAYEVRLETVKRLAEIGGPRTIDPLLALTSDYDPEIQIWAIDGLVNVYLPGYLKTGISRTLSRAGNAVRVKFGEGQNDQVIDSYVNVDPRVVDALGRLTRGASSSEARANAARSLGILRGQGALPALVDALYSKDSQLMFESLIALQKIRDPQAGPRLAFLVRDLEPRIQIAALQAAGILRAGDATADIRYLLQNMPSKEVEREALTALAMIGDAADRNTFLGYLPHRDDNLRAAAAEGLARVHDTQDRPMMETAFSNERDTNPRLSMAFALVAMGNRQMSEFSPLQYLVSTLNRGSYRNVALAFLTELTRDPLVRQAVYPSLTGASKNEKTGLAIVLGRSGDRDTVPYLEALQNDSQVEVAQEGLRALRALSARMP